MGNVEGKYLIGRQPILDGKEQVTGYELLFRSTESLSSAMVKNASQATASVIINTLSGFGLQEILGDLRGYINIDTELFMSDSLELLPKERIALELQESIAITPKTIDRCRLMKKNGFILALDDHSYNPDFDELYDIVDIIKIDMLKTPKNQLQETLLKLRRHKPKLLAEKVDNREVFDLCKRLGFDFYQGYFFARPSVLEKKSVDESAATLLKLLRLLLADATITELEQVFRSNPAFTFKLLMLVNSVAMGVREKIRDVRHAITLLGRQQIQRWVQLSLFSSVDGPQDNNPLMEMAAVRATFMELIAAEHPQLKGQRSAPDKAYMVGILSLMERIYQISTDEIVNKLNLSDEVRLALTDHAGIYGSLLEAAELVERLELSELASSLQQMGIPCELALASQLKAYGWRHEMG
ncbi:MAG: HDOD domain-containing protein [Geobacter sp.]|nr:HDOD domain-containing protein [Geobacter sp.]